MILSNPTKRLCRRVIPSHLLSWIFYQARPRDVVLLYHSVEEHYTGYEYSITTERLIEQISILKKRFRIVSAHEILKVRERGRRAALTFDDAFADFYHTAFPILREACIPATVFVPTSFIETEVTMLPEKIHCTWEQMREMQENGLIDFQSHGHNHRHIRAMNSEQLRDDILESKNIIESNLGNTVDLFAYPGGKFLDWQHEAILELGFKAVFTSVKKTVGTNRKVLPRIFVGCDCDITDFHANLSGMREIVYRKP